MNCPYCGYHESKVNDSRPDSGGRNVRRRRECLGCSRKWRTIERIEDEMPLVLKNNGTYQPFEREKILTSIRVACGKRPVQKSAMERAVAEIEWAISNRKRAHSEDFVTSREIGNLVMHELKSLDDIAYVRFASIYRRFSDVNELIAEMKDLVETPHTNLVHSRVEIPQHSKEVAETVAPTLFPDP
jgi:transcriptional repressor NrdR